MHANYFTPCLKQTAFAALLASSVLLGGCAKVYHMVHYNPLAEAVQEHQLSYYHSPQTGRIIPKEHHPVCPVELPCFGYEPTCWYRWPGECVKCPVPGETIISDLPFGSGTVVEEVIEEKIDQPMPEAAEVPPEPAPPTDDASTDEPPRLEELIDPADGASIPINKSNEEQQDLVAVGKTSPLPADQITSPADKETVEPLVWSESIDLARETYEVMLASAVEPVDESSTSTHESAVTTSLFELESSETLGDDEQAKEEHSAAEVPSPSGEATTKLFDGAARPSQTSSRRQTSTTQQHSHTMHPLLPPDLVPAAITKDIVNTFTTNVPTKELPRFKITPHLPPRQVLVDADEGLPKPSPLQVAPIAPVEVRILAERAPVPNASSEGEKNTLRFR